MKKKEIYKPIDARWFEEAADFLSSDSEDMFHQDRLNHLAEIIIKAYELGVAEEKKEWEDARTWEDFYNNEELKELK